VGIGSGRGRSGPPRGICLYERALPVRWARGLGSHASTLNALPTELVLAGQVGYAVSSSGDGLLTVALPLLALILTKDPLAVAWVVVGMVVVAIPAAHRRASGSTASTGARLMLGCSLVSGLALVALLADMSSGRAASRFLCGGRRVVGL
jgi:hypothetical protein